MFLKKILLKNYRNLKETILNLNPNLNILVGFNGQGKTNFLESIYLLGTGSSHRTSLDSELINWDKEQALIQILLARRDQELKISVQFINSQKKIEINNTPIDKVSELIGNVNVVLFSPEDLNLVKGGPANRRKFLDVEVSQVSSYYYYLLQKYNHVLKQRNNYLKKIRNNHKNGNELLDVWDKKLVELGSKIILKRMDVVEKLAILARLTQRKITNGSENLELIYQSGLYKQPATEEEIKIIFNQDLVNNRKMELERGYTVVGPHRDDLILKINGIDVRKYGSQGQQRTTALALKLAELEYMKSETGEYPILLLDDVFSELDQKRRSTLIQVIANKIQTFITATDFNNLSGIKGESYQIFEVKSGKIDNR